MYYDYNNGSYYESKTNPGLKFLYNRVLGRLILKLLTKKAVSNIYAKYMTSKFSKLKIKKFIKNNNIDMSEYIEEDYSCFNDFFIRQIKPNKRKIQNDLIAVCDSKLSVYKITKDSTFKIKNSIYTIEELIGDKKDYKYALIFRLCVDDYHHYVYPDNGKVISKKRIEGRLHTVQPISSKRYKVFHENTREITYLDCNNLGEVAYIEVGALLVGKIVNEEKVKFTKGEEKGHFEFGGSTVIMLTNKEIKIDKKILENTEKEIETIVKLGNKIGTYK
jgi:phosphatidylserine decarboxylase